MIDYLKDNLVKAEALARKAHAGQVDKAGQPYFLHVETVSQRVGEIIQSWRSPSMEFLLKAKIVGYLHDIVEDTDITMEALWGYKVPTDCILAIKKLTKNKNTSYQDYLLEIKRCKLAAVVKVADMTHNSDLGRLAQITEEDRIRQKKYLDAIEYLSSFTCEHCHHDLPLSDMGEKASRVGEILCQRCLAQYELDYDAYEDYINSL